MVRKVIYVIPSWYPSKALPNFGSFIREQCQLFAMHQPDLFIVIGVRSDTDLKLSFTRPFQLIWNFLRNSMQPITIQYFGKNIAEITFPAFSIQNFPQIFTARQRDLALQLRCIKYCEKHIGGVNVFHAHVINPGGAIAMRIARKFKIPLVVTEHRKALIEQLIAAQGDEYHELVQVVDCADEIIAVSNSQAQLINSICNRFPLVIPNFINEGFFVPKRSFRSSECFVFSTLCSLIEGKGVDLLLKAIQLWMPEWDKVHFKIGGTGYLKDSLQGMAFELKISHLITWTGFVSREQAPAFYQDSDAFVLPSRSESFGIVYIEALACGLPVIATRCGGPEEIVNNLNGLLIDIDDVEQLVMALKKMYQNYNQYDRGAIRDDFITRFSSRVGATRIMDVYNKLIN
ncbi:MAG: glycosyltransferase [Lentimicrobium sp.]|nr:glycosyltransferase [Lentimicrobium sp.]MEA5109131.1 glycosyltransferase [Lentimicrobium sp.]